MSFLPQLNESFGSRSNSILNFNNQDLNFNFSLSNNNADSAHSPSHHPASSSNSPIQKISHSRKSSIIEHNNPDPASGSGNASAHNERYSPYNSSSNASSNNNQASNNTNNNTPSAAAQGLLGPVFNTDVFLNHGLTASPPTNNQNANNPTGANNSNSSSSNKNNNNNNINNDSQDGDSGTNTTATTATNNNNNNEPNSYGSPNSNSNALTRNSSHSRNSSFSNLFSYPNNDSGASQSFYHRPSIGGFSFSSLNGSSILGGRRNSSILPSLSVNEITSDFDSFVKRDSIVRGLNPEFQFILPQSRNNSDATAKNKIEDIIDNGELDNKKLFSIEEGPGTAEEASPAGSDRSSQKRKSSSGLKFEKPAKQLKLTNSSTDKRRSQLQLEHDNGFGFDNNNNQAPQYKTQFSQQQQLPPPNATTTQNVPVSFFKPKLQPDQVQQQQQQQQPNQFYPPGAVPPQQFSRNSNLPGPAIMNPQLQQPYQNSADRSVVTPNNKRLLKTPPVIHSAPQPNIITPTSEKLDYSNPSTFSNSTVNNMSRNAANMYGRQRSRNNSASFTSDNPSPVEVENKIREIVPRVNGQQQLQPQQIQPQQLQHQHQHHQLQNPNSRELAINAVEANDENRPVLGQTKVDQLMLVIQARAKGVKKYIPQAPDGSILEDGEVIPPPIELVGGIDKIKSRANAKKKHQCKYCFKNFTQSTHLEVHLRSHIGLKPYKCEHCGKSFTQGGNLRTHLRSHTGERPFKCEECDRSFSRKGNLAAHKLTHSNVKPFKCKLDNCDKGFTQLGNLKAHQNRFHLNTVIELTNRLANLGDDLSHLPPDERETIEYFMDIYKNSNKGIKGRGKKSGVAGANNSSSPTSQQQQQQQQQQQKQKQQSKQNLRKQLAVQVNFEGQPLLISPSEQQHHQQQIFPQIPQQQQQPGQQQQFLNSGAPQTFEFPEQPAQYMNAGGINNGVYGSINMGYRMNVPQGPQLRYDNQPQQNFTR